MPQDNLKGLSINRKSKQPLHIQVEELLRDLIKLPQYKTGGFLPKEIDLAETLGISRNTIRQATNKLENEGLLIRKKGIGTTVAPRKTLQTSLNNWYSFTKEMKRRGVNVINMKLHVEQIRADKKIAELLNIKKGSEITRLSKLKGFDGDTIVYFESYFSPEIQLSLKDDLNKPLYELLEEKYKIVVERSSEQINAITNINIARKLKIKNNAPILFRERLVFDANNRPIEYNLGYYRSDKFSYSVEIKKEQ
jgi:GntR family transcriptional regulator